VKKTTPLTYIILTLLFLTSITALVSAATTETFNVTASTMQYTFDLPQETTFNASLTTTNTIRVWIHDQNGSQIVNLGLVDKEAEFSFITNNAGKYYVNFENNLGNTVKVTFTYQTYPELPNDPLIPLSYWPIFAAITTALLCLIIYWIRHKKPKTLNETTMQY